MNFKLYYQALRADDAYQRELVRVYGAAKVGDARYQGKHTDPQLIAARAAKLVADDKWAKEVAQSRLGHARALELAEARVSVLQSIGHLQALSVMGQTPSQRRTAEQLAARLTKVLPLIEP